MLGANRIVGPTGFTISLGVLLAVTCNVYNESLLGGSRGEEPAADGGAGDGAGGTEVGTGGTEGGADATGGDTSTTGGTMTAGGGSGTGGLGGTGGDSGGTEMGGSGGSAGSSGATGGTGNAAGAGGAGGAGGTDGGSSGKGGGAGGKGGSAGSAGACGVCGCGMSDADTDSDTVPDCNDVCMGFNDAHCNALESGLVHRYSFGGTGTQVSDSKGTAHGTAINATLTGTGTLTLAGGNTSTPPYVNLPNGLISSLTNATIETWVTWNQSGTTGQNWQRIFDFGTTGTEDMQVTTGNSSMSYIFLCPRVGATPAVLRAGYTTSGLAGETTVSGAAPLPTGTVHHLVFVLDDTNNQMLLYLDGSLPTMAAFTGALADVSDVNNWLGRSSHSGDYEFAGVFDEFRIYDVALTPEQISTSLMAGPNAAFL